MAQYVSRNRSHVYVHNNKKLLEAVFSVRFVPSLYNEGQLPLLVTCEPVKGDSHEAAVCEFTPGAKN
jgi:hypothetical protein